MSSPPAPAHCDAATVGEQVGFRNRRSGAKAYGHQYFSEWLVKLEQARTSHLLLGILAGAVVAGAVLYKIGLIGWVLRVFGMAVRGCIRGGFRVWEVLLGWASWSEFLAVTFVLASDGWAGWCGYSQS